MLSDSIASLSSVSFAHSVQLNSIESVSSRILAPSSIYHNSLFDNYSRVRQYNIATPPAPSADPTFREMIFDDRLHSFVNIDGNITILSNLVEPIGFRFALEQQFDPICRHFYSSLRNNYYPLSDALLQGVVDGKSAIVKSSISQKWVFLAEAVVVGLVESDSCSVKLVNDDGEYTFIDFDQALVMGYLKYMEKPIPLINFFLVPSLFSAETGLFTDPCTNQRHSLSSGLRCGLIDPCCAVVFSASSSIDVTKCIQMGIIDADNSWLIIHQELVSLDRAYYRGLLVNTAVPLNLDEAIVLQIYSTETSLFSFDEEHCTLKEAVQKGYINASVECIFDAWKTKFISLLAAARENIIDPVSSLYHKEGSVLNLKDAYDSGLIRPLWKKMQLTEAIQCGFYDYRTGTFLDPTIGLDLNLSSILLQSLIDVSQCAVRDITTDELLSFDEGIRRNIINLKHSVIQMDPTRSDVVELAHSLDLGILLELPHQPSLFDFIEHEFYNARTGLFFDYRLGRYVTLRNAMKSNLFSLVNVVVVNSNKMNQKPLSFSEAIADGIIDVLNGKYVHGTRQIDLARAVRQNLVQRKVAPLTLHYVVVNGLLEPDSCQVFFSHLKSWVSFRNALSMNLIDRTSAAMKTAIDQLPLSVNQALGASVFNRESGQLKTQLYGRVNLYTAHDRGLLFDPTAPLSLYHFWKYQLVNRDSVMFHDFRSERQLDFLTACKIGVIDVNRSYIYSEKMKIYVDLSSILSSGRVNEKGNLDDRFGAMTLQEAFESNKIAAALSDLSLNELLHLGLFHSKSGLFWDPASNQQLSLLEMFNVGYISYDSIFYFDNVKRCLWSMESAMKKNLVSKNTAEVVDVAGGSTISFKLAFQKQLIRQLYPSITFELAFQTRKLDLRTCLFFDDRINRQVTLQSALETGILDCSQVFIKDYENHGVYMPIRAALKYGYIDLEKRCFVGSVGLAKPILINFGGTIVIIKSQMYAMLELIEMACVNFKTGIITNPHTKNMGDLKLALDQCWVDPDSALVKETKIKKLLNLNEACTKTLILPIDAQVFDVSQEAKHSYVSALSSGLMMLPNKAVNLLIAMEYGLFDPTSETFRNPFAGGGDYSFGESLNKKLIDISDVVIRDPATGVTYSMLEAIQFGLVDPVTGHLFNADSGKHESLHQVFNSSLLCQRGVKQDLEKQKSSCEDRIDALLMALMQLEEKFTASQGKPNETKDGLLNKATNLKDFKTELQKQESPVADCINATDLLTTEGADILSPDEFHNLRRHRDELKDRLYSAENRCDTMIDRLTTAANLRAEFDEKVSEFRSWIGATDKKLDKLKTMPLRTRDESAAVRSTVDDIIDDISTHYTDLDAVNKLGRRTRDEIRGYIDELNQIRSKLSKALPPVDYRESEIQETLTELNGEYENLRRKCDDTISEQSAIETGSSKFSEKVAAANAWLTGMENNSERSLKTPKNSDPTQLKHQLSVIGDLLKEAVEQETLLRNAKQAGDQYLAVIQDKPNYQSEKTRIGDECAAIEARFNALKDTITDKQNDLQATLTHSQGLKESLDSLVGWLNEIEPNVNLQRSLPMDREKLEAQQKEQRLIASDVEGHRQSVEACTLEAQKLFEKSPRGGNNPLRERLTEVDDRYNRISNKVAGWAERLENTIKMSDSYNSDATKFDFWLRETKDHLNSKELTKMDLEAFNTEIARMRSTVDAKQPEFDQLKNNYNQLLALPNIIDTTPMRTQMRYFDESWSQINAGLKEREGQVTDRKDKLAMYSDRKAYIRAWLDKMEQHRNNLDPVALDLPILDKQGDELTPILREFDGFRPNIQEINGLATSYLSSMQGSEPEVKKLRKEAQSPVSRAQQLSSVSPDSMISSGIGSFEQFPTDELPHVQSETIDITNRYDLLGKGLNDRQDEIDNVKEKLEKHQDDTKQLKSWIDEKKRKLSNLPLPLSKDESQKMLDEVKEISNDVLKRRSDLEDVKDRWNELKRLKDPSVVGIKEISEQVADLADHWESLIDDCKEGQQKLQDAKDFYNAQSNLRSWLTGKQRMMAVLGPVASDPKHIKNQKDQVDVLRDEFEAQRPQLDMVNQSGSSLLDRFPSESQDGQVIASKMADVNQVWEDLLGKLEEREKDLSDAEGLSVEFSQKHGDIKQWLGALAMKIDELTQSTPTEGAELDRHLSAIDKLKGELDDKERDLANLNSTCEQLCDVSGDPSIKAHMHDKIQGVKQPYAETKKKLESLQSAGKSMREEGEQFDSQLQQLIDWMDAQQKAFDNIPKVSANGDKLIKQLADFEVMYKDILDHEGAVSVNLAKGHEMLKKKGPNAKLEGQLKKVDANWIPLLAVTKQKKKDMDKANELSKDYNDAKEKLNTFMDEGEKKLTDLRNRNPQVDKKSYDAHLKDLIDFRTECATQKATHKATCKLGEKLIQATGADHLEVQDEIDKITERWEKLNDDSRKAGRDFEGQLQTLLEFGTALGDAKNALQNAQEQSARADAQDTKGLEKLRKILDDVDGPVEAKLKAARELASKLKEIADKSTPPADTTDIDTALGNLDNSKGAIGAELQDKIEQLEAAAEAVRSIKDEAAQLQRDQHSLDDSFANLGASPRDLAGIEEQRRCLDELMDDVDARQSAIDATKKRVDELRAQGFDADADKCQEQVEKMQSQLDALKLKAAERQAELGALENTIDDLLADLREATAGVKETGLTEILRKPISGDLEGIKKDLEMTKTFKDALEPLAKRIDQALEKGRDLVRSAGPGVDTAEIDAEIGNLATAWNGLQAKIAEREQKLNDALLGHGNYQESLNSLLDWLHDTEELTENQKEPSADYKVVKAQLQEQKMFQKLIDDKKTNVRGFEKLVAQIAEITTDDDEREQLGQRLEEILDRYEALANKSIDRNNKLEAAQDLAEQWENHLEPFKKWLDNTERQLSTYDTVPTDEARLQKVVEDHKNLHEEIKAQRAELDTLRDVGVDLHALVGDEDRSYIDDTLDGATARFDDLESRSEEIIRVLADMAEGVATLMQGTENLSQWLDEMQQKVDKHQTISVFSDQVEEQTGDLMNLAEEIAENQGKVSEVVEEGFELCKHTSGDEAITLQRTLEDLRTRFTNLNKKADERLGIMAEAVPLVQSYHTTHESLSDWLKAIEGDLTRMNELSMEQQDEWIKSMDDDVALSRPMLEQMNNQGVRICQLSSEDGAQTIEEMSQRVNQRFETVCGQIQRWSERLVNSKQRNMETLGDMEDLINWFHEAEQKISFDGAASCDPHVMRNQLKETKELNAEVMAQKTRSRDAISKAKKLAKELSDEDQQTVHEKIEVLKDLSDIVAGLSADRLSVLEQALPLAEHFAETYPDTNEWLSTVEIELENAPAVIPGVHNEQLRKQKDHNNVLQSAINDYKPLIEKLVKTGHALGLLCNDEDAAKVNDMMDQTLARFDAIRENVKERGVALDDALQQSSHFDDKLNTMLDALTNTADQVKNAEAVSSNPDKLRKQIEENSDIMSSLDKKASAYQSLQDAAEDIIQKADPNDPAVREIQDKLDHLRHLWKDTQDGTENRGRQLADTLSAAERFWDELEACLGALDDLRHKIEAAEAPACEPEAVAQQQEQLKVIEDELRSQMPRVENCRDAGQTLLGLVGDSEKPEVQQKMNELDSSWDTVTSACARRHGDLIDAMEKAMNFHELMGDLYDWLGNAEKTFASYGPVSSDLNGIQKQIDQLKGFKTELDEHAVGVQTLNQETASITDYTSPEQALSIKRPVLDVNKRWDALGQKVADRQQALEKALLQMGQFQQALDQLLDWLGNTEKTLDDIEPAKGNLKSTEIALAKLKVLMNDVTAHQSSVDTLNDAGRKLIQAGVAPEGTQGKLDDLKNRWNDLEKKLQDKQAELEVYKAEAESYDSQLQDWLQWLQEVEPILSATKPVGGLPETAQSQLENFMPLYDEMVDMKPKIEECLAENEKDAANAESKHSPILQLKKRWANFEVKAEDRKRKLEIALKDAQDFADLHDQCQQWLSTAEMDLNGFKPISRILQPLEAQMEEHSTLQEQVQRQRELMTELNKKGTQLKYFSQKQDVILIKNLLVSTTHRWDKVQSRIGERGRQLDAAFDETKRFTDQWRDLTEFLEEGRFILLDEQSQTIQTNKPEKIKEAITKHNDFHRKIELKRSSFESTIKLGKQLKDHAPKHEVAEIQEMIDQLKVRWQEISGGEQDQQRKLEEALLFCGQFKDAVKALSDWVEKIDPLLIEDVRVHGDIDTVNNLCDQHKNFIGELKNREKNYETVKKAAEELLAQGDGSEADEIKAQMDGMNSKWQKADRMAEIKTDKLADALNDAEQFHKECHTLLEWLADVESRAKSLGPAAEDPDELDKQLSKIEAINNEFDKEAPAYDSAISLGRDILAKAHPDAVVPMEHWLNLLEARWSEISGLSTQKNDKVKGEIDTLKEREDLTDELLQWLKNREGHLDDKDKEPIPDDLKIVEKLLDEHEQFQDELRARQPDVETVTKPRRSEPAHLGGNKRKSYGSATSLKGSQSHLAHTPNSKERKDSKHGSRTPKATQVSDRWNRVWLKSSERQRKLNDMLQYMRDVENAKDFDFDDWRRKYMAWMNHKKSRVMDFFRRQDKDGDGKVTRSEFIEGILQSKFPTNRVEMNAVADIFDKDGDGYIDYKEFIAALRPERESSRPLTDHEKIKDEVKRQVHGCSCHKQYKVTEVGEGKYRFGESQKLRLVRILRSTVMVRVGGGWVALDEFLVKNDPCRAKGRTNLELREKFILPDGASQTMQAFKSSFPKTPGGSSVGSSAGSTASTPHFMNPTGPVMKIREKTERSLPMRRSGRNGSFQSPDDSEVSAIFSGSRRSSRDLLSPNERSSMRRSGIPAPSVSSTGSRPGSRTAHSGIGAERPPSRADSEASDISIQSRDSLLGTSTPSRIPSLRKSKLDKPGWK